MTYKQDYCPQGDYFICSETSMAKSEPEKVQEVVPSQSLPLDTSSYQSVKKSLSKPSGEISHSLDLPLDTPHYRKSSVRKTTYRVTKK